MNWSKESAHLLTGELSYKIARYKVADKTYYRASFGKDFISGPMTDLNEAKKLCEDHKAANHG